jgi:hypothetical protein
VLLLVDLRPPLLLAALRPPLPLADLRVPLLADLPVPLLLRAALRAPVPLLAARRVPDDEERPPLEPRDPESSSSSDHLPDITRWAASATASAIKAPSLLALDMTLVAACDALSAASIPASRILRRAAGLALIAAAAAARPAPSISRLIAALVILSTVDLFDRDEPEPFFVLDFAIAKTSRCNQGKTLQARNGSRSPPNAHVAHHTADNCGNVKGDRRLYGDPLRHGQRPEIPTVPG